MSRSILSAVALAMVISPTGVSAEILSEQRLQQILKAKGESVSVETIQARDRDLLVAVGVTLREKYGQVLDGAEIVFRRLERSGRIVYRMDFLNVKTSDHAKGICHILEVENCVILRKDGDISMVSAEFDSSGLLSMDHYVPFEGNRGVVRTERLPTVDAGSRFVAERALSALPIDRPLNLELQPRDEGQQDVVVAPSAEIDDQEVAVAAPLQPDEATDAVDVAPELSPSFEVEVPAEEVTEEPEVARSIELSMELPLSRPGFGELGELSYAITLPSSRPYHMSWLADRAPPLPKDRPVTDFGLHYRLPVPRDFAMLSGEFASRRAPISGIELISDRKGTTLLSSRSLFNSSNIVESLSGYKAPKLGTPQGFEIEIPGKGRVKVSGGLPNIAFSREKPISDAVMTVNKGRLELALEGVEADQARNLPNVFVLAFAQDGITAITDPKVEPAKPALKIASVVMTDAFSVPFDMVGDGNPKLQKIPKLRPDFDLLNAEISLVSARNANRLLGELYDEPMEVAQVPGVGEPGQVAGDEALSPGDRLLKRLSGLTKRQEVDPFEGTSLDLRMESPDPEPKATAGTIIRDSIADVRDMITPPPTEGERMLAQMKVNAEKESQALRTTPVDKPAREALAQTEPLVAATEVPKRQDLLPRHSDGLVDIEALPGTDDKAARLAADKARALEVLGQIATASETPSALPESTHVAQAPRTEAKGLYDVARSIKPQFQAATNPLRIELAHATSRDDVPMRAKEIEAYIPDVILAKGRFYGQRSSAVGGSYIIGIEAQDMASRDDIIWYLEKMMIPYSIRR